MSRCESLHHFFRVNLISSLTAALSLAIATVAFAQPAAQPGLVPAPSVNMVGGPVKFKLNPPDPPAIAEGDPFLQRQNEPSCAVMTRNPLRIFCGANDYRTVDLPGLPEDRLTGDAWLGQFWSVDGGATWWNSLLPGFLQDRSPEGLASPIHGYEAGADPTVRAGVGDMIYYSGIAFNRSATNSSAAGADGKNGVLFVARFNHPNLPDDRRPPVYLNTVVVDSGSQGRFLDKPWLAVDSPRPGGGTCSVQVPGATAQTIPAGHVYLAYAVFVGNDVNVRTKVLFSRSTNCGATWSNPTKLSEGFPVNQGTSIGIDPRTGWVYVVWRRMAANAEPDGFMYVVSKDGGATFTKAETIAAAPAMQLADGSNLTAYLDQKATSLSIRTVAFPTIAVGDSGIDGAPGPVYVAWAQRWPETLGVEPIRDTRVVLSVGTPEATGVNWSSPAPVHTGAGVRGHQIQPSAVVDAGKLAIAYVTLQEDHTAGLFTPVRIFGTDPLSSEDDVQYYSEWRKPVGDLANPADPYKLFTDYIYDFGRGPLGDYSIPLQRRHTMETWLAHAPDTPGPSLQFTPVRVSQYAFGKKNDALEQFQYNPPNLKLFTQGTVAFVGDYIDIGRVLFRRAAGGAWIHNTTRPEKGSVLLYPTWTDNRDIRPPADGDWTKYTPVFYPELEGKSIFSTGQMQPACDPNKWTRAGMRNQNVYATRITEGLFVSALTNQKPLSTATIPREDGTSFVVDQHVFPVTVKNETNQTRTFRLVLGPDPTAPDPTAPDPTASFDQFSTVSELYVKVLRRSSVSRNVFVKPGTRKGSIRVDVYEVNAIGSPDPTAAGLQSFTILNPDPTAPDPTAPDPTAPDPTAPDPTAVEIYNIDLAAPDPTAASVDVTRAILSPDPTAPDPTADGIKFPDPTAPDPTAPDPTAPDPTAPDPTAIDVANPDPTAPDPTAPDPTAPDPTAPDPTAQALTDTVYKLTNTGDSAASYRIRLLQNQPLPPGFRLQLMLNRFYSTPAPEGCRPAMRENPIIVSNIPDPVLVTDAADLSNPDPTATGAADSTITLGPREVAYVTVRLFDPVRADNITYFDAATGRTHTYDPRFNPVTALTPAAVPPVDNVDAAEAADRGVVVTPQPVLALTVSPGILADAVIGSGYEGALHASGGTPPYTWEAVTPPPSGMILSPAGVLSGSPTVAAGTYSFTVRVTDSSTPAHVATAPIQVEVVGPLVITTTTLPGGVRGQPYSATLQATGGSGAKTWTLQELALPSGLTLTPDGAINGSPMVSDAFSFWIQVTDSGTPPQVAVRQLGIEVVEPLQITAPVLLGNAFTGVAYSQTFEATGGTGSRTWTITSGTLPDGLTLSAVGILAGIPSVPANSVFTVQVVDAGPPQQTASRTFTIDMPVVPQTYTVSSTADSGAGSLRQAILYANANTPARDTIVFAIAGAGPHVIAPVTPLPEISDSLVIDGASQPGYSATPLVEIDGINAGGGSGLVVSAPDSSLRGLAVTRWYPYGIHVLAPRTLIAGNHIGIDPGGSLAKGNGAGQGDAGVRIRSTDNRIGGAVTADRNIISGNVGEGVLVTGDRNTIEGNYIGVDITGNVPVGNSGDGVTLAASSNVVGGTTPGAGNLISANSGAAGVRMASTGSGNAVKGNRIGTNAAGTAALGNRWGVDVLFGSTANQIGGAEPGAGNLISGNLQDGIGLNLTSGNVVEGNIIGADMSGATAVPNGGNGVSVVRSSRNTIGGTTAGARNVISGNASAGISFVEASGNFVTGNFIGPDVSGTRALGNSIGVSVTVSSSGNTVGGTAVEARNIISGNRTHGVSLGGDHNQVLGNFVGTDRSGMMNLGNGFDGVYVTGAANIVGGSGPARNVISSNRWYGVEIAGVAATGTVVQGNYVGVDSAGTSVLENGLVAVHVVGAPATVIGGDTPGTGNLVSDAIRIQNSSSVTPTLIMGNLAGTDATGNSALAGGFGGGILLLSSSNVRIGGPTEAARNVIAAGAGAGISAESSTAITIQGNYVGTNRAGTVALPNAGGGIVLLNSNDCVIGGTVAGAGNLVSGNGRYGVLLEDSNRNVVVGNLIGTDAAGTGPLGNAWEGVSVRGSDNAIGGINGEANTIAWNGFAGVAIAAGSNNAIRGNAVHDNAGLGIDIGAVPGITLNDNGDPPTIPPDVDAGSNDLQNFPVLSSASSVSGTTYVAGSLTSTPNTTFTIDLYASPSCDPSGYGEGARWLSMLDQATDGAGTLSFDLMVETAVPPGYFVTATATSRAGSTSEFSACTVVGTPTSPSGTGWILPATPPAGSTGNLLVMQVTPGQYPTSTGITVVANGTAIGGPASIALDDEGMFGPSRCDDVSGDGMYLACFDVSGATAPATYTVPVTISDAQGRTATALITIRVPGIGSFHGRFVDASDSPLGGVSLRVQGANSETIRTYLTAIDGTFMDLAMPADTYSVYSGFTALGTFTVTAGMDTTFTIRP